MTLRSHATTAATGLVVLAVAALAVGQLLGQPVLLGYVATDSMAPTMEAGDGFVAVPAPLAGDVEEGDVVVFEAEQLPGGGLTTHRVVAETDAGYVTKGDANPFTDQDGGEPPVGEGRVVAKAAQVNGEVIVVPHLGTAVMTVQSAVGAAYSGAAGPLGAGDLDDSQVGGLLVALGLAFLGAASASGGRVRDLERSTARPGVVAAWAVAGVAAALVVALATAAMVVPAGVHEYGIVSADQSGDDPLVIGAGETASVDHDVHNGGVVPVVAILEPGERTGVDPDRVRVGGGEAATATVRLTAPDRTGYYHRYVTEHRYLLVLPPSVIAALHDVHPALALLAVDAVVAGLVLSIAVALLGTGDLRLRSAGNHVPPAIRLARKLRKRR